MGDSKRDETKHDKPTSSFLRKLFWILVSPFGLLCFVHVGVLVYEAKHPDPPKPAKTSRSLPPKVKRSSDPEAAQREEGKLVSPKKSPVPNVNSGSLHNVSEVRHARPTQPRRLGLRILKDANVTDLQIVRVPAFD